MSMSTESKISVVINTYNARQHLRQVLESVKDFDEVVVCDMESTDDTCDIAREYGCRIVTFPKHPNCARCFIRGLPIPTVLLAITSPVRICL